MILNEIQGIKPLQQTEMKFSDTGVIKSSPDISPSIFGDLISSLDSKIQNSNSTFQGFILNQGVSTHDLMISMENAKQSLQIAVEVRNKIIESYEKITQIGI